MFDGTPCAVKVARTVWGGGKPGDDIKGLPIVIFSLDRYSDGEGPGRYFRSIE